MPRPHSLTALDIALINDHAGCASYLMACHAPSGGGVYHRAAATIQAVWQYHRHKVCTLNQSLLGVISYDCAVSARNQPLLVRNSAPTCCAEMVVSEKGKTSQTGPTGSTEQGSPDHPVQVEAVHRAEEEI